MAERQEPHLTPHRMTSMALLLPMALISRCVPPMPGMTPKLTSGCTAIT